MHVLFFMFHLKLGWFRMIQNTEQQREREGEGGVFIRASLTFTVFG